MPLVKPVHVFAQEKEIAIGRAIAETHTEVQAELNSLREEVQTLREPNPRQVPQFDRFLVFFFLLS